MWTFYAPTQYRVVFILVKETQTLQMMMPYDVDDGCRYSIHTFTVLYT